MSAPLLPVAQQGVDNNGIKTGEWKAPIFGCLDSFVPNGLMTLVCPCVSLSQVLSRLGFAHYTHALIITFSISALYLIASIVNVNWLDVIVAIIAFGMCVFMWYLRLRVRNLFGIPGACWEDGLCAFFCSWCSLAQIATHVESYNPGACSFETKATLPGYSL